jgi:hypothetical protein
MSINASATEPNNLWDDRGVRTAQTIYFRECGRMYTEITVDAAVERAIELGLGYMVVASTTGYTAKKALAACRAHDWPGKLVVITEHVGYHEPGFQPFEEETREWLTSQGVAVHTATHALSSITRAFRLRWQGIEMLEIVAETLRRISRGTKTAIEATIMAANAGLVPVDEDVVAVGGTGEGADSAIVLRPAAMNAFFDLKVREFIAMPQVRTAELEPVDLSSPEAAGSEGDDASTRP